MPGVNHKRGLKAKGFCGCPADLAQWVWDEFALSVTRHTLGRELRAMGYRKLSARPRYYGQKPDDIVDFKKTSPPVWRRSGEGSQEERQ
ncbi:MAG: winged helix-turn-helix domain-containing protein [Blastomonas sp.]|nr:winged helix-turn-helix domain-containing protein [Blastomonas sp.]